MNFNSAGIITRMARNRTLANLERLESFPATIASYSAPRLLLKPEIALFARVKTEFSGKRILDLGVGGGQTTSALLEISENYVGSDVSPQLVSLCRKRFPTLRFEVCDSRDLSQFESESFDLVVFSGQGIDSVGHIERMKVLSEVYRVLANGGAFIFSSHNLRSTVKKPWHPSKLPTVIPTAHPRAFAGQTARFILGIFNHLRNRRFEEKGNGYAILNDEARNFTFLLYYIGIETQIRQLADKGFHSIDSIDMAGNALSAVHHTTCQDAYIHYLCRKD